ncbi:unnamed protein product [Penicillium roqueforti FM164]|uniref:Genomic scaffold, ProqFM164S02 n=1 Tax=Penicillium roqueforti (strain FM164) TaxID=1365484 RepID=W6Q4M9_PENRF|nr:unnamed protein product [Penicillium roqueforti FM164]
MGKYVIRMLRANGGDSAYVLTSHDNNLFELEQVPSAHRWPNGSDILGDVRGVHTQLMSTSG